MSSYAPSAPPPGWYLDPSAAGTQRWWDGAAWTEFRAPAIAPPPAHTLQPIDLIVPPPHTFGPRGLIWGIIAFVLPMVVLPAVLALVFSIPALVTARRARHAGQPVSAAMPLAGVILAGASLAMFIGTTAFLVLASR